MHRNEQCHVERCDPSRLLLRAAEHRARPDQHRGEGQRDPEEPDPDQCGQQALGPGRPVGAEPRHEAP